jgi:hypothetical protein
VRSIRCALHQSAAISHFAAVTNDAEILVIDPRQNDTGALNCQEKLSIFPIFSR